MPVTWQDEEQKTSVLSIRALETCSPQPTCLPAAIYGPPLPRAFPSIDDRTKSPRRPRSGAGREALARSETFALNSEISTQTSPLPTTTTSEQVFTMSSTNADAPQGFDLPIRPRDGLS